MNPVHVHLMLNHFPVIGLIIGLLVLFYGIVSRSEDVKRTASLLFVLLALISIPVYLTGEPAEERVEDLAGVSHDFIEEHEEAALISFIAILALGLISLVALFVRNPKMYLACFVLALVAAGMILWTANLGGKIRHSEIRSGSEAVQHEEEDPD